jgi:hypothetical protein
MGIAFQLAITLMIHSDTGYAPDPAGSSRMMPTLFTFESRPPEAQSVMI